MQLQLAERHVIKRTDPRFAAIDRAAFASKNLYNAANYELRQAFIFQGVYLSYPEMQRQMKDHEAYHALPAKVAQQVLRVLDKNWHGFFAALAAWRADPAKFLGRPKLPRYKDKQHGRNLLVYTIQALSLPALRASLICPSMLGIVVQTKQQNVQQVRIIPRIGFYVVEVIYERDPIPAAVNPSLHARRWGRYWAEQSGPANFRQAGLCPACGQRATSEVYQPILQQASCGVAEYVGNGRLQSTTRTHHHQTHAAYRLVPAHGVPAHH